MSLRCCVVFLLDGCLWIVWIVLVTRLLLFTVNSVGFGLLLT